MRHHEANRQRDPSDRLERLDGNTGELQPAMRVAPLHEHRLLLAQHGRAGAVGTDAGDAQQRVEVEANQHTAMAARPHLALRQQGEGQQ
jgi:hypothetical protein